MTELSPISNSIALENTYTQKEGGRGREGSGEKEREGGERAIKEQSSYFTSLPTLKGDKPSLPLYPVEDELSPGPADLEGSFEPTPV